MSDITIKVSIALDASDFDKLRNIVDSGEAASVSHAVRLCIRAYTPKISKEVST